ncbi:hypothetical protein [Azohydromonas aeria]|uniref:hypothetical protein n=1 Tax=Azohydromonas aeria TaxID=2590212 RepID=UPI0012FA1BE7|nr:hypothetical protein [Azohydromonas aeria]
MKALAIPWLLAAAMAPSAYAIDMNWGNHDTQETWVRNLRAGTTFVDDARYMLTPMQSRSTSVRGSFQLTKGTIEDLTLGFYGDYYGPDQLLATFKPGETFSFDHLDGRIKYYFLITGSTTRYGASYTLTSNLVPKTALGQGPAAAVPEPSEYAMFALGVGLLPLVRRLRRRRGEEQGGAPAAGR